MTAFKTIDLPGLGKKYQGKVRDFYILKNRRIIITTDRQSAFDRILGFIPLKGQALNQLSAFWFKKTADIVPNHLIAVPDPNVMIVKNCQIIPIEMVVRGYITGVTGTSIWGSYEEGERVIYGIRFPDGLCKNQRLPKPVITPTTKATVGHDERLTEKEILRKKIRLSDGQVISPLLWRKMKKAALALFLRGTKICARAGIILVDTKYEFGLDEKGKLTLIDEVHTPDSSRFWIKKTYLKQFKNGLEPEYFDKEILRIWFKERGYSGEGRPPKMPPDFIAKVSKRYIKIYEIITGEKFKIDKKPVIRRIKENLKNEAYCRAYFQ